jgi:uncharacterized membrane protein
MYHLLDGLLWAAVATGVAWLLWTHRGKLGLRDANAPGETGYYRWPFYLNPNDGRLFVRDLTGIGWTVNLAHPAAAGALIAVFGTPFAVLFVLSALHG